MLESSSLAMAIKMTLDVEESLVQVNQQSISPKIVYVSFCDSTCTLVVRFLL